MNQQALIDQLRNELTELQERVAELEAWLPVTRPDFIEFQEIVAPHTVQLSHWQVTI